MASVAFDYSPVAVTGSQLLTDYLLRDWSAEPQLALSGSTAATLGFSGVDRILSDVEVTLREIGQRFSSSLEAYYPSNEDGTKPWGYLWSVALPCPECGNHYPLYGNNMLQSSYIRGGAKDRYLNVGQSFRLVVDKTNGSFEVLVHDGEPVEPATLRQVAGVGKSAVCPFCSQVISLAICRRLTNEGKGVDRLLLVADFDAERGKSFRTPTELERAAIVRAAEQLPREEAFGRFTPAVPDEGIAPGNNNVIGPSIYGARTFGDLCNDRQTLSLIRLCRAHNEVYDGLVRGGISGDYAAALTAFGVATMLRKLMRSTRGAQLQVYKDGRPTGVNNIWTNETSLAFSFDYFEVGIGTGAGSWDEAATRTLGAIRTLSGSLGGREPAEVQRGSATHLPLGDQSVTLVVTDPPYDEMIPYADASDLYFVWLRRAMAHAKPELLISADAYGAQEKAEEIIVKRARGLAKNADFHEHRTREHYDAMIQKSFREVARVLKPGGVCTIVFGHGEPEVWQRLLKALGDAGLVMCGSWPASTEGGGQQGKANIKTTLTMVCRVASKNRATGRKGAVEAEIKAEIKRRYPEWEQWGLAPADMLMAAAGPAMEVVGRYESVLDARGEAVDIYTFLPLARAAVQAAMAVEVDHHPLETFDSRSRFGLWWVRLYGRQPQAKSELRWQALASSMDSAEVRDLVPDADKGVAFTTSRQFKTRITVDSAVIDVALALAAASEDGLASMGEVLAASGHDSDDPYLWAAVKFLADRLPDADPDAIAFTRVLRTRDGISNAAQLVVSSEVTRQQEKQRDDAQLRLL